MSSSDRPWYREELWLAAGLTSVAAAGLAFAVPASLKHEMLAIAGLLTGVTAILLVWREMQLHSRRAHSGARPPERETSMPTARTWRPLETSFDINDNGKLDPRERRSLPDSAFAFPAQRELPLVDADHVLVAIERVADVRPTSDDERALAAVNIAAAAAYFGLEMREGERGVTSTRS